MKDYASIHYGGRKKSSAADMSWRHCSRAETPGRKSLLWKVVGTILICSMMVGIITSFWLGHCIQQSLTGIAQAQELNISQQQLRGQLLLERKQILAGKKFKAMAAVQVGLYSPVDQQEIKPR